MIKTILFSLQKKKTRQFFLLAFFSLLCTHTMNCQNIVEKDSIAIINFHKSLVENGWSDVWDTTQPINTYQGVHINDSGKIYRVTLDSFNQDIVSNGQIPDEAFEHLADLEVLNFLGFYGFLEGPISSKIGLLENLEFLYLYYNNITELPSTIGDLKNLTVLELSYNELQYLPATIGNLSNLGILNLEKNLLDTLPNEVSQLNSLVKINISHNQFTSFPIPITEIQSLREIRANDNIIEGEIPTELWDRNTGIDPRPLSLYINNNYLSGRVLGPNTEEYFVDILDISYNNYTLQDLQPDYENLLLYRANINFMPQRKFGNPNQIIQANPNETTTDIFIEGYQPISSNEIAWYKNGFKVGDSYPLTVNNGLANQGRYYCKVTNSTMPEYEINSYGIPFVIENQPPHISTSEIKLRRGETPNFDVSYGDDFTYTDLLTVSYSNETEHLQIVSGKIITKDPNWIGMDTIEFEVTDNYGVTTQKDISIIVLPEENTPPTITLPNVIYSTLTTTYTEACLSDSTTICEYYFWNDYTLIYPFVEDDLDSKQFDLKYSIKEAVDGEYFSYSDLNGNFFSVEINSEFRYLEEVLEITGFSTEEKTINITLEIKDSEGLVTEHPISLIFSKTPPNLYSEVTKVPDQIISTNDTSFDNLDLKKFIIPNEYTDLYWEETVVLNIEPTILEVNINSEGIVTANPKELSMPLSTSVTYGVMQKTNYNSFVEITVNYIVTEETLHTINFKVFDVDSNTVPNATLTSENGTVFSFDSNGYLNIENLTLGATYHFTISAPGFKDRSITKRIDGIYVYDEYVLFQSTDLKITCTDGVNTLPDVEFNFNGNTYTSDSLGEILISDLTYQGTVNNLPHSFMAEKEGYYPITGEITLDNLKGNIKTLIFTQNPIPNHEISFKIEDTLTNPITGAIVNINSIKYTTATNGLVTIEKQPDGSYPYTVSADGFIFHRGTLVVSGNDVIEVVQLETSTTSTTEYIISGVVLEYGSLPLANVTITGFPNSVTTDANGEYTTTVPSEWSGTITTQLTDYTFSPENYIFNSIISNQNQIDFIGKNITLGTIAIPVIKEGFFIAPNPSVHGEIVLHFKTNPFIKNIKVFNLNSSLVKKITINETKEKVVLTHSLSKGIYFIIVETDKGLSTNKVIVN